MKTKDLAVNALIAALYIAITLLFKPFSYGPIQVRLSEALLLLLIIDRKFMYGLIIGCFIANFYSDLGMYDVVFGTFATVLTCYAMIYAKNDVMRLLYPAIFNGVIVGIELTILFEGFPLILNILFVAIGEIVAVFIPGMLLKDKLKKLSNTSLFES